MDECKIRMNEDDYALFSSDIPDYVDYYKCDYNRLTINWDGKPIVRNPYYIYDVIFISVMVTTAIGMMIFIFYHDLDMG